MVSLTIEEILGCTEGAVLSHGKDAGYTNVVIDSRKVERGSIFVGIKGENFDGNDYVENAIKSGAVLCIMDRVDFSVIQSAGDCTLVIVKDTQKALAEMAKYYIEKLGIKVIGVTGSVGKTTTRELIASALGGKYNVYKTSGNFNNHLGLPLSILSITDSHQIAVLEMGMNHEGEIRFLADIARPDMAVITNVGVSHIENLGTRENILKAKMEIANFFDEDNVLIVNGDNDLLSTVEGDNYPVKKASLEGNGDIVARSIVLEENGSKFTVVEASGAEEEMELQVLGKHNVSNALLAICCARTLGLSYDEIRRGLKNMQATDKRLEIIKSNCCQAIINDCYNASPDSMEAAISVLKSMSSGRKIAVLGTMRELGDVSYAEHCRVGKFAKMNDVDMLLACGEYSDAYEDGFGAEKNFRRFQDKSELIQYLKSDLNMNDVVLVKASRGMKFEEITSAIR